MWSSLQQYIWNNCNGWALVLINLHLNVLQLKIVVASVFVSWKQISSIHDLWQWHLWWQCCGCAEVGSNDYKTKNWAENILSNYNWHLLHGIQTSKHAPIYKLQIRAFSQPSAQRNNQDTPQWTSSAVHTRSHTLRMMLQLLLRNIPRDTLGVCN